MGKMVLSGILAATLLSALLFFGVGSELRATDFDDVETKKLLSLVNDKSIVLLGEAVHLTDVIPFWPEPKF